MAVIGILSNVLIMEAGTFPSVYPSVEQSYVNYDYVTAVNLVGGVPLQLPVIADSDAIRRQIEAVDGVILSGGYDVNPLEYGEQPRQELGQIVPEADYCHLQAARIASELGKPMLGICRGMQILNVAFGGTLYQDVVQVSALKHVQNAKSYVPCHAVNLEEGTRLQQLFGRDRVMTNSFHHQAVKAVAPGFVASARTSDGVIEAIERPDGPLTLGVQWHPEMMARKAPEMKEFIKKFAGACERAS